MLQKPLIFKAMTTVFGGGLESTVYRRNASQRSWSPTQSGRPGSRPQGRSQCDEFLQALSTALAPTAAKSILDPAHPDRRVAAPRTASPAHTVRLVPANMA